MEHTKLRIWKLSMLLARNIYAISEKFPKSEIFGLTSQLRRSAVSVPSNIAEGAARQHTKEYINFLYIALGSLAEIETQLELAKMLGYTNNSSELLDTTTEIRNNIVALIRVLKQKIETKNEDQNLHE